MRYANITLRSNGQLWSNPTWRSSSAGLPAMLVNPSFLDLLGLCIKFSPARVTEVNDGLLDAGEISQQRHQITASMLVNIGRGLNAH